jgi:hypothetical protein
MEQQTRRKRRETILSITLAVILVGLFVFFLNLVSLGIFFHVSAAIMAIVIVGYVHYLLWGHSLSEEVAGERAMEKLKEELEAEQEHDYDDRVRRYRDAF